MTSALDVLFLLRRIYAERSPDPSVNPAGWALVSERNGLYLRRKLMQSISPTVMVQRCDKVVQGLAAEDILNAVASLHTRKICDDRIEAITPLESYGNGAGTFYMQTKPSFPFRGRAFHVAHITAKTAPLDSLGDVASTSLSKPPAFFYAAASFPEDNVAFPAVKLNPTALPVGKVLVDGWILETLDPYASSTNQIPSTRLTHIVAIDYAGSLPATVNSSWNAPLPRVINQIDSLLKIKGIPPATIMPPACMLVVGDGRDERSDMPWVAEDKGLSRVMLHSDFDAVERKFTALSMQLPPASSLPPVRREHTSSNASTERGPQQSFAPPSTPPFNEGAVVDAEQISPVPRERTESEVSRVTSIASLSSAVDEARKATSTRKSPPRSSIWFEVEVELKPYPQGYDVSVKAFLPHAPPNPKENDAKHSAKAPTGGAADLRQNDREATLIPTITTVHDLPPSALLAASLDAEARGRRHLIRVRLSDEEIQDGESGRVIYSRLASEKAFLIFSITANDVTPNTSAEDGSESVSSGASTPATRSVSVNGNRVDVMHVNKTSAMMQREDRDSDAVLVLRK